MSMDRRHFLASSFAATAWTLGLAPGAARAQGAAPAGAAAAPAPGISPWLRLHADGRVVAYSNVADIGQGTWSTLKVLVAEQLDVPAEAVTIEAAPLHERFLNPFTRNYATYGSLGWRSAAASLNPACAAAREMLTRAAAARWGVPAAECHTAAATVHHAGSGRQLAYGALLADAAQLLPPEKPPVRLRAAWQQLGRPLPRPELAARVEGRQVYGIDVRRPGQLYASVLLPPSFGGRLVRLDDAAARRVRGVVRVLRLPALEGRGGGRGVNAGDAVAVVATNSHAALQGVKALRAQWRGAGTAADRLDSEALRGQLLQAVAAGAGAGYDGRIDPRLSADKTAAALAAAGSAATVDLSFDLPYLAHAPMEPLSATVQVTRDQAELWLATQSPLDTRQAVAAVLGLAPEQVQLHLQTAGGGFGRRAEHDWVVQAARIAQALPGRPVQLLWPREVELRAGLYRPVAAARVRVALGADGWPTALRADLANPALGDYSGLTAPPLPDWLRGDQPDLAATMGWLRQPYALALDLRWTRVDPGVPVAYWRSVGASSNTFFHEVALDVAARRGGHDPVALRRRLMAGDARALAFLDALLKAAGWERPAAPGVHRGLAIGSANGSISGHVVELELTTPGRFRLLRIVAAIDPGVAADPLAVQAQMQGGTVFGLGAALAGEISFRDGQVEQGNFDRYALPRLADVPPIEAHVVAHGDRSGGVGEEGVPTIAPAIANALFAATGRPVTRLPLSRAGWQAEPPRAAAA